MAFALQPDAHGPIEVFNNAQYWETYIGGTLGAAVFLIGDVLVVSAMLHDLQETPLMRMVDLSVLHSMEPALQGNTRPDRPCCPFLR